MNTVFKFGEPLDGYPVPVLNERAVRAGAGILFVFAFVAFMNAWLLGNFEPTRVFVVAFLIDFTLRIFVNPRYAPSLVLGQWLVRKQQPEWTGAPQKRFAWGIGLVLALTMFWLLVVQQMIGPVNILVCAICLTFMFFESALGICIGCKIYEWVVRKPPELCPGGVCAFDPDPKVQPTWGQGVVTLVYLGVVVVMAQVVQHHSSTRPMKVQPGQAAPAAQDPAEIERCTVPEFAKRIGHEDIWKRHNNCL
jgi:hypothetical protein